MTKSFKICRVAGIAAAVAMIPLAAHAQGLVAGGGTGGLDALVAWLLGPIGRPVLTIGAMGLGIVFAVGRRDWEHMVNYAIGGGIIGYAIPIAAMFATGG